MNIPMPREDGRDVVASGRAGIPAPTGHGRPSLSQSSIPLVSLKGEPCPRRFIRVSQIGVEGLIVAVAPDPPENG